MLKYISAGKKAVHFEILLVGVDDVRGTPVPIPNTEVKPSGAEDTWLVTAWKIRAMPT